MWNCNKMKIALIILTIGLLITCSEERSQLPSGVEKIEFGNFWGTVVKEIEVNGYKYVVVRANDAVSICPVPNQQIRKDSLCQK